MSKIHRVEKSRKEQKCSKCGKAIPVGSAYIWSQPRYMGKIIRCVTCGLKPYETSSSEYVRTVGNLQEHWQDDYGIGEDTVDEIVSALEELKESCEAALDNMPDSLRESSPTAELLEGRMDQLETTIDALQDIDLDELRADCEDVEYEDYDDEDDDENDVTEDEYAEDEWSEELKQNFCECVDEALGNLEY